MNADAEACIKALLDAVEQLPPAIKALWTGCTKRDFNLGFACGATPCFELSLSSETLKRIADQRASVTVTLYPSATEPAP